MKRNFAIFFAILTAACQPSVAPPTTKLVVNVRVPPNEDNPLTASAAFIAMIADFPGTDGKTYQIQPYAQGVKVQTPAVPYGPARQIRVDVYQGSADTGPTVPFARGISAPVDVYANSVQVEKHPYVTLINHFASVFGEPDLDGATSQTQLPDSHVATGLVALPGGQVLLAGGGAPKTGSKDPFDIASYGAFQKSIALYDPDTRGLTFVTSADDDAEVASTQKHRLLAAGRAFHTMCAGEKNVAIVGGAEMDSSGKPAPSDRIEFYDMQKGTLSGALGADPGTEPRLKFARVKPTVVQMFEHQDYFLVLGGQGDPKFPCPNSGQDGVCAGNTYEVWHAQLGFLTIGKLATPRWHHAGVRVPGPTDTPAAGSGGYVMLIGGENNEGPLTTMEIVQFLVKKDNTVVLSDMAAKCPADCPRPPNCDTDPNAGAMCGFLYNTVSYGNQQARIWPGALFVAHIDAIPSNSYYHVYTVGGFNDAKYTSANKTVDVFDIQANAVIATRQMKVGRAAPALAAVTYGPGMGEVLIAGGSSADTSHQASGEFLHVDKLPNTDFVKACLQGCKAGDAACSQKCYVDAGLDVRIDQVENLLSDSDRTLGAAVGLNTGHVLILGGAGSTATGMTGRLDASLWNPY